MRPLDRLHTARLTGALLCCGFILTASAAWASDLPKRKSGLWEITSQMEGMPGIGPVQLCVDQASDDLMQQQARQTLDCSAMEVSTRGNRVTIHSVCQMPETKVTSDAVFTGSFDAQYRGDMKMRYEPPVHGMSQSRVTIEAKWLGPCKPGQKAGDVVMSDQGSADMQKLMNDPQFRDMMKDMNK